MTGKGLALVHDPMWTEADLWYRIAVRDEDDARQRLFTLYLPFAKKIAAREYHRRRNDNYDRADLEQWAMEALLQAINRFDPTRRIPFTAYARRRITGHIADGIASMSEVARQSRHYYLAERERLEHLKQGATGEDDDPLAALRRLAVGLALGAMLEGTRIYVDESQPSDLRNGYDQLLWKSTMERLDGAVDDLPPPKPFIIRQHYQNGVSFRQIAKLLKLSAGRISQLHREALSGLRQRLGKI
ncbi:MAG: sigma-70 family RNA polymerase sigma factor [Pseudomonadota bacterium]